MLLFTHSEKVFPDAPGPSATSCPFEPVLTPGILLVTGLQLGFMPLTTILRVWPFSQFLTPCEKPGKLGTCEVTTLTFSSSQSQKETSTQDFLQLDFSDLHRWRWVEPLTPALPSAVPECVGYNTLRFLTFCSYTGGGKGNPGGHWQTGCSGGGWQVSRR